MAGRNIGRLAEHLAGGILSMLFFALCCTLLVLAGYSIALVVSGRGTLVAWMDLVFMALVAVSWYFRKVSADPGGGSKNKTGNNKNKEGNTKQ